MKRLRIEAALRLHARLKASAPAPVRSQKLEIGEAERMLAFLHLTYVHQPKTEQFSCTFFLDPDTDMEDVAKRITSKYGQASKGRFGKTVNWGWQVKSNERISLCEAYNPVNKSSPPTKTIKYIRDYMKG